MFVATIKPRVGIHSIINELLHIGIENFRINFARSSIEDNLLLISSCYDQIKNLNGKIFIDLPGNKIRVCEFINGFVMLKKGQLFTLDNKKTQPGDNQRTAVNNHLFIETADVGDLIMIGSGKPVLRVIEKQNNNLVCKVLNNCKLYRLAGIKLYGKYLESIGLTNEDKKILESIDNKVDFICPSFVDNKNQIKQIRNMEVKAKIIAKIESPIGVREMDSILHVADGLMLCRGDLKNFYSLSEVEEVGYRMKKLVGQHKDKILVFATDYFSSMVYGDYLSTSENEILSRALAQKPDFIIINETSYSKSWKQIAKTACGLI